MAAPSARSGVRSHRTCPWQVTTLVALVALTLCGLGSACASTGFDGSVYRGEGFAFRIPPPPAGWTRLETTDAALAFRHEAHRGTVMIHGRCGFDGDDVPLSALTAHLFLQFTERQIETQEVVPFDGREAMHTVLDAKLDGVAMRYDVWVLKKDGCVYDLLSLAPSSSFAGGHDAFTALVRGFATVKPSGH